MKPKKPAASSGGSAEKQLAAFIAKFEPGLAALIRACRAEMQKRLPTAVELAYDNYNFLVIGYGPSERSSEAIFSIAASASGAGLAFLQGATLPDPKKLLQGSGTVNRFIRLPSLQVLTSPEVRDLMNTALARAKVPLPATGGGYLVIKSVSARQRPRRKVAPPA